MKYASEALQQDSLGSCFHFKSMYRMARLHSPKGIQFLWNFSFFAFQRSGATFEMDQENRKYLQNLLCKPGAFQLKAWHPPIYIFTPVCMEHLLACPLLFSRESKTCEPCAHEEYTLFFSVIVSNHISKVAKCHRNMKHHSWILNWSNVHFILRHHHSIPQNVNVIDHRKSKGTKKIGSNSLNCRSSSNETTAKSIFSFFPHEKLRTNN